jgi:serine/threonine protein kinase
LLKKEPLPDKLILNYFQQICEGLAALHLIGIAHRDLKPANVLLAPNDRVVIMDLGKTFNLTPYVIMYKVLETYRNRFCCSCFLGHNQLQRRSETPRRCGRTLFDDLPRSRIF